MNMPVIMLSVGQISTGLLLADNAPVVYGTDNDFCLMEPI
jgi:hypothetical protein